MVDNLLIHLNYESVFLHPYVDSICRAYFLLNPSSQIHIYKNTEETGYKLSRILEHASVLTIINSFQLTYMKKP